jgi:TonB family protein
MQQSIKICLIVSLSAHLCMTAVIARYIRERMLTHMGGKPEFYISLDAPATPERTSQCENHRGKREEPVKRVHSLPQEARTATPRKAHETSAVTIGVETPEPAVVHPPVGEAHSVPSGQNAPAPSATSISAPASEKTETSGDNGRSGGGDGKPSVGTQIEDFSFGSETGPSFLHRSQPTYPPIARRFGKEGKVVLRLTIDKSGSLSDIDVLEDPGYGFAAAAVAAMKKSTFHPARRNGKPVMARAILPVRFTLRDAE